VRRFEGPQSPLLLVLGGVLATAAVLIGLAQVIHPVGGFLIALSCVAASFVIALTARRLIVRRGVTEEAGPHGRIDVEERALVESIIDFGDTVVREVMVPRTDMITVEADFRAADVIEVMLLNGYSRLPACGAGIDDVVGLVYAKDLMRAERDGLQERPVGELLRPATFVPETKRVPELLREMQQQQFHMAIVVDEYGGTAGLVTLEDIIEELVGEILDEYDVEDPMIEPLPGGDALVRGRTSLAEVNDLLQAKLPEGDWDTVGGLVYSRLNHVPVEGETVEVAGWRLTAQRIQGRRIGRVRMTRISGSDEGVVGGLEALPFGLLIFVVGALLIANVWAVVDAKLAVSAAASSSKPRSRTPKPSASPIGRPPPRGWTRWRPTGGILRAARSGGARPRALPDATGSSAAFGSRSRRATTCRRSRFPGSAGSATRSTSAAATASWSIPIGTGSRATGRHAEADRPRQRARADARGAARAADPGVGGGRHVAGPPAPSAGAGRRRVRCQRCSDGGRGRR
jgi:Mg2+/Co2+ transporter CorC